MIQAFKLKDIMTKVKDIIVKSKENFDLNHRKEKTNKLDLE